jgi:hypothetical protein
LLHDEAGTPFLLLAGPEPDLQWERFIAAVVGLDRAARGPADRRPERDPDGRAAHPPGRHHRARQPPDLIAGYEPWLRRVQVPGSAGNLLEYRLGKQGRDAMGFAVHVPHYVAQSAYPAAAQELLESVSRATGLLLPTGDLRSAADLVRPTSTSRSPRTARPPGSCTALEEQYDAYVHGRQGRRLLAEAG